MRDSILIICERSNKVAINPKLWNPSWVTDSFATDLRSLSQSPLSERASERFIRLERTKVSAERNQTTKRMIVRIQLCMTRQQKGLDSTCNMYAGIATILNQVRQHTFYLQKCRHTYCTKDEEYITLPLSTFDNE